MQRGAGALVLIGAGQRRVGRQETGLEKNQEGNRRAKQEDQDCDGCRAVGREGDRSVSNYHGAVLPPWPVGIPKVNRVRLRFAISAG